MCYRYLGWDKGSSQARLSTNQPDGADSPPIIRPESLAEHLAIRHLVALAFERPAEADLVDRLRDAGALTLSLVAVKNAEVVGHVAFSPVTVGDGGDKLQGLGPLSVHPGWQGKGIGAALIGAGFEILRDWGIPAVVVLGDPAYYGRFGFELGKQWGLACRWEDGTAAFRAIELVPGGLSGRSGMVDYHRAFNATA